MGDTAKLRESINMYSLAEMTHRTGGIHTESKKFAASKELAKMIGASEEYEWLMQFVETINKSNQISKCGVKSSRAQMISHATTGLSLSENSSQEDRFQLSLSLLESTKSYRLFKV